MPWPCGAADYVAGLAERLAGRGLRVVVVTSNPRATQPSSGAYAVEVVPGNWGIRHQRQIWRAVAATRVDVVDFQYEASMYGGSPVALAFPILAPRRRPAIVLTMHSAQLPRGIGRLARVLQFLPYAAVTFYSDALADTARRWFPKRADRFFVRGFPPNITDSVAPAVRPLIAKIKAGLLRDAQVAVYFGHIGSNRGIEDLLVAAQTLKERGVALQWLLLSQFRPREVAYHRVIFDRVVALGLRDVVSCPGDLSAETISNLLAAADFAVLPFPGGASQKNGSLAAMFEHGVPTVTTRSASTEPALIESGALLWYAPGDVDALVGHVEKLALDHAFRLGIRERACGLRDLVAWEGYLDARLSVYDRALDVHPHPFHDAVAQAHAQAAS